MNQIATMNAVQTMTSRDIAELTGKQHFHVIRDIEQMASDLHPNLDEGLKSTTYTDANGVSRKQYELDKEMTMTLVTGYSIPLRHAVIKRWQELERQQAPALPATYIDALERLLESKKAEALLQAQIEEYKPDLEYLDTITHHTGSMSVAEAAKSIGTGERRLYAFMRQHGWITRNNVPYQDRVDSGHLDFTRSRYDNGKGELRDKYTTRVTEKGKNLLYKRVRELAPSIIDDSSYAAAKEGK